MECSGKLMSGHLQRHGRISDVVVKSTFRALHHPRGSTSRANTERRLEALKTLLGLCQLTLTELARRACLPRACERRRTQ